MPAFAAEAKMKKALYALLLLVLAGGLIGCFGVRIRHSSRFPAAEFAAAEREIARLEAAHPERVGRVHRLHVLVYDGSEGEFVRASLPMWLVKWALKEGIKEDERERWAEASPGSDFAWEDVDHLRSLGPGLLARVQDEEDQSWVLAWLD